MLSRSGVVIISDNPSLSAAISSAFSGPGQYVSVLEGPRLRRPDATSEVIRLVNVIGRLKPRLIIYADQPKEASQKIAEYIETGVFHVNSADDLRQLDFDFPVSPDLPPNEAAKELYRACSKPGRKRLAVVFENTGEIDSVIAANYAIARNADLYSIEVPENLVDDSVDLLNKISGSHPSVRETDINTLTDRVRSYLPIELLEGDYLKIMFVTEGVPYSLAMSESSTIYAHKVNLGQHITHNLYDYMWGQQEKRGVIGLFAGNARMDTEKEYELFTEALTKTRGLAKKLSLTDTQMSELEISTLPYDALYVATHGSQIMGRQNKYTFSTKDAAVHEVITKEGVGVGGRVVFIHSIDGIEKEAAEWTKDNGRVWGEFIKKHIMTKNMPEPIESEPAELRMRELVLGEEPGMGSPIGFDRLASAQRPLVIVNACGSWTDLSTRFVYAGATAYIGTLWPIRDSVAVNFAKSFFDKVFDEELMSAFHGSRLSLTSRLDRIAYTMSGTFESKYDPGADYSINAYEEIKDRLKINLAKTQERLDEAKKQGILKEVKEGILVDELFFKKEIAELENI